VGGGGEKKKVLMWRLHYDVYFSVSTSDLLLVPRRVEETKNASQVVSLTSQKYVKLSVVLYYSVNTRMINICVCTNA
jgi:hypothetical protein